MPIKEPLTNAAVLEAALKLLDEGKHWTRQNYRTNTNWDYSYNSPKLDIYDISCAIATVVLGPDAMLSSIEDWLINNDQANQILKALVQARQPGAYDDFNNKHNLQTVCKYQDGRRSFNSIRVWVGRAIELLNQPVVTITVPVEEPVIVSSAGDFVGLDPAGPRGEDVAVALVDPDDNPEDDYQDPPF